MQECRGLIVDFRSNFKVVAFPYLKFFNYGEENAAPIDWTTAKVYDKVDGSLATLYWYKGEWNVSSSGTPDASGAMPNSLTFAEIFWNLWHKLKYKLPVDTSKCYMFEMFARQQRIVVPVNSEMIFLHGVRDLQTLQEVDPIPIAAKCGYQMPTIYPLSTLEECIEAAKKLTPDVGEGYVVVDANFNRIKIKSPTYVAISHLNSKDPGNLNYRSMLNIVRTNESSEFLAYFPQWKPLFKNTSTNFRTLVADISQLWDAAKDAGEHDSKEFAIACTKFLATKDWPNKDVYFNIAKRLQGGLYSSVLEMMREVDIKVLLVLVQRFGVHVIQSSTTKVKPLSAVQQQQKSSKKANRLLDQVQGPPKEPVFDQPSSSASSSSSGASSSNASSSISAATSSSDLLGDASTSNGATKAKKTAKKTQSANGAKTNKAAKLRAAEEAEMRAFLQKLEDRNNED